MDFRDKSLKLWLSIRVMASDADASDFGQTMGLSEFCKDK